MNEEQIDLGIPDGLRFSLIDAQDWLVTSGVQIVILLAVSWIVLRIIKAILNNRIIDTVGKIRLKDREQPLTEHQRAEKEQRLMTLNRVIYATLRIFVAVAVVIMILSEIGVEIGPLLAGAGVAGLAIGFGAQSLVKDYISGLFMLLEDQFGIGDIIEVEGVKGTVIEFNLRRTVLLDFDGTEFHIANSKISKVANFSDQQDRIGLTIGIDYDTDIKKALDVLRGVADDIHKDKEFGPLITQDVDIAGVDEFADSAINIKVFIHTKPTKRYAVKREFLKRVKEAFDKHKIEIPYPHTVMVTKK